MADITFSSDEASSTLERQPSAPPLHRKYLRAFHDYQPDQPTITGSTGGVSITAPLKEGDVILIHLTHSNGWADGTILSTGNRGWIPTNYCQVYDPRPIRSLLHALTRLWDFLSSGTNGEGVLEDRQDYVQGLVAGVRRLLEHCDCLHRDDSLIKKHIGLRRTRKSLLADLSFLMHCREEIHNTFSEPPDATLWSTVDQYLSSAFKVACRAVRFLDIWTQSMSSRHMRTDSLHVDTLEIPQQSKRLFQSTRRSIDERYSSSSLAQATNERPKSRLRIIEYDGAPDDDSVEVRLSSDTAPREPDSSPPVILRSYPAAGKAVALEEGDEADLASERLTAAHEQFLGDVGAFIGLHLQSRTSVDLAATTQRSIRAAEDLLLVVTRISERDSGRSQGIASAVDSMRKKLARLAETANRLCKPPITQEDPEIIEIVDPEDGRGLVAAATACVRAAGDCTAKTRKFLDHITGDFFLGSTCDETQSSKTQLVHEITPRAEVISEDWPETVPGAANPGDPESDAIEHPEHELPRRPISQLRSTTDDTNNFTLSSVLPDGTMRRPESLPPPAILCDSPTSPNSPKSPLGPPQVLHSDDSPQDLQEGPKGQWTTPPDRKGSLGMSVTESSSAYQDSLRNSVGSVASPTSTRATTPDKYQQASRTNHGLCTYGSVLSLAATTGTDNVSDHEAEVLARSHAHELLYNKEGQIVGGTLAALVERLTSQHAPPDPTYNTSFLLTFRLFTNAPELAQTLVDRYQYAGESSVDSSPARLRVYNFFKTWLESHYLTESDEPALKIIRAFATEQLSQHFSGPGQRLIELTEKAAERNIATNSNQLVSAVGKTIVSLGTDYEKSLIPHANVNKDQLYLLMGSPTGEKCSLMDLDAVEVARQLTIIESRIFCAIEPRELLGLEWTKKNQKAANILAISRFSTDLTHLVADTVLSVEQVKKRALVLKHWIKIAKLCLEINNFSALMAIACSLTSSTISRLRHTWDQLSAKSKVAFDEIKEIVDVSRNYAALRQRLQTPKTPCLPFVGMYLTDLTFVDAGNQNTRPLPNNDEDGTDSKTVINFDKHMRSARIIGHLQHYQVPYRLQHVREIQQWLETQLERVRNSNECTVQSLWRRSQALEPRTPLEDEKRRDSVEEKDRHFAAGFMGGRLRPKNKASISGLNAFMSKSKNDILARVKTSGSGSTG